MLFKKIKVTPNGVYILDADLQKKIDKIKLSPSMIGNWLNSPADYILDKFIKPEVEIADVTHLKRGNWFHSTMEVFFALPQEERTRENLLKVSKEVTLTDDYKDFAKDKENQEWYKRALKAYIGAWLDDAKKEKIATMYIMGQSKPGLELFVNGTLGNANRQCLGFIDKIVEGENGLKVQDWKTGKKISNFNPNAKISTSNPFDYWRQQTFYAMLLEQLGATVEETSLLFPCAETPTIIHVDHHNPKVREQVIKDVEQVDRELDEAINNKYFFPFKKGPYNSWASYLVGLGRAPKPNIREDKFAMLADLSEVGGRA